MALRKEIESMTDETIVQSDFDEWLQYYLSKYQIDIIELFEEHIIQSIAETKVRKYNPWHRDNPGEQEYYLIDGYIITYDIPYDGNTNLLYLQPDSFIMMNFEIDDIQKPNGDNVGHIIMSFDYTKQELKEQSDVANFTKKKFQNEFNHYKTMFGNVNANAEAFNASLNSFIKTQLETRKTKAVDYIEIREKLNIPLMMNENAPNTTPIPLKKIKREPVGIPKKRKSDLDYVISDSDYKNIVNIIDSACQSMEATARTFCKNDEEELRDFIVATLNTHYDGKVTGETFRKIGKTDINILFDNKAAYIAECKIWHGIKRFKEAIEQLFGYSTWKDSKMSLIVFNKDNKDFVGIRKLVEIWIKENVHSYDTHSSNSWQCKIIRPNSETLVEINIAIYDLKI